MAFRGCVAVGAYRCLGFSGKEAGLGRVLTGCLMTVLVVLSLVPWAWAAPTVTGHQPANHATVPLNAEVQGTFSEPLDPASLTPESFTLSRFPGVRSIAAGGSYTVALKHDGTVVAWGVNNYGQSSVPTDLSGVIAIAASGMGDTLALKKDGTVVAWGSNWYGGATVPPGLADVVAIAAGGGQSLSLKNDGRVVAWGLNGTAQGNVPADLANVTAIAAGAGFAVALKSDGTVVAWGNNSNGQCTVPANLAGVTAVAAGGDHTVALKNDGTVVAWGLNDYGQATVPAGLSGVIAIGAAGYQSIALKSDGTVVAWGSNIFGESTVPLDLAGVAAIAVGGGHTAALKSDGTLVAWGSNGAGEVTIPAGLVAREGRVSGSLSYDQLTWTATLTPSAPLSSETSYFATISGVRSQAAVPLSAPFRWSFTAMGTKIAVAPAAHDFGSVGLNTTSAPQAVTIGNPGLTSLLVSAVTIEGSSAGLFSVAPGSCPSLTPTIGAGDSCAVNVAFTPTATGARSATLQVASNATATPTMSVFLNGTGVIPTYPLTVSVGGSGTVDDSLGGSCGGNCSTQVADGTLVTLTAVAGSGSIFNGWSGCDTVSGNQCTVSMAGARSVTASFASIPRVVAYQPANGSIVPVDTTVQATFSEPLDPASVGAGSLTVSRFLGARKIAAGGDQTVAIGNDDALLAWETDGTIQTTVPASLSGVIAFAAGNGHVAAVKSDGTVIAWGDNTDGQTTIPAGLSGVTAIAAGNSHTMALRSNGTVLSWGWNNGGTMSGTWLSGVAAIAAGGFHNLALKNNGTVTAWGYNDSGQTSVPGGLAGVTAIAGGLWHSVALKSDGTVVAWGANGSGQTTVPADLAGVKAIAVGDYHTVALRNDGTVVAWGDNDSGQCSVPVGLAGVVAIAAGNAHTVALKSDGSVVSWGRNNSPVPVRFNTYEPPVSGATSYNPGNLTLSLVPAFPLVSGSTYYAAVAGLRSQEGVPMAAPVRWSFKAVETTLTLGVAPAAADFGVGLTGETLTRSFTLSNSGLSPLVVSAITLTGTDAPRFSLAPGSCPSLSPTIGSGESCTVNVTFAPTVAGLRSATLKITSNATTNPLASVPLSGTGVLPTYLLTISTSGTGSGTVSYSTGGSCAGNCSQPFSSGTLVTLTPMSASGSSFGSWSGCDTVTGNRCTLTMTGPRSVTASFALPMTVSAYQPSGTGVSTSSVVQATFSQPLDPASVTAGSFTLSLSVGVKAVAVGYEHTLALKNDGTVVAWGRNTDVNGTYTGQAVVPAGLSNVKAIAAGSWESVALKNDGSVVAWGSPYSVNSMPAGLTGVKEIGVGESYMVALKNDGTVVAWGGDSFGQCQVPAGLSGVKAIAVGDRHALALKNDGTVVAWGYNIYGQATVPAGLSGVVAIAVGYQHSVALKSDGTVVAWGNNNYGETTVPAGLTGVSAIVAGSNSYTLALKSDGTVVGWGRNDSGQISIPAGLSGVTAISAGYDYNLAFRNDGTLVAWGERYHGQVPAGLTGVVAVDVGYEYSVAIKSDGTLVTWGGTNMYGKMSIPAGLGAAESLVSGSTSYDPASQTAIFTPASPLEQGVTYYAAITTVRSQTGAQLASPLRWSFTTLTDAPLITGIMPANGSTVPIFARVSATFNAPLDPASVTAESFKLSSIGGLSFSAGKGYTFVLQSDGTPTVWGDNYYGKITVPGGLAGVTAIAGAYYHSAALKNDGTVIGWGSPYVEDAITRAPGLSGVVAIAVGELHTVALTKYGTVESWGVNGYGGPFAPVPSGLSGVVAIAAGDYHSVALKNDGTVVAWGRNSGGQTDVPAGLTGVVAIAAGGEYQTAALKADGTVVAWGYGSSVPAGLTGVVAISVGAGHMVALKGDGTVVAWGDNGDGQATVPAGLTGVTAIAAGGNHNIALKSDGTLVGWGGNSYAQATIPAGLRAPEMPVSGSLDYDPATLTVTFTPATPLTSGVSYFATVAGIRSLSGTSLSAPVRWSFRAAGPSTLLVAPQAHDFGNVFINSAPIMKTFAISNPSATTMAVSDISLEGSDAGLFSLALGSCPSLTPTIVPGGSCTLFVSFAPTATGARNAFLKIASNATVNPTTKIPLSGTGEVQMFSLVVNSLGAGSGTISYGTGGSCVGTCSQSLAKGTVVTLTATPDSGMLFGGWSGCDYVSGNSCTLTMNYARQASATFAGDGVVPTVISYEPADGAVVPVYSTVQATFSEPLRPGSVTQESFTLSLFVGVKAISAGAYDTLALRNDGTVVAWGGYNYYLHNQARVPAGLSGIVAVAAGQYHSTALRNDGTLVGWGYYTPPAGLSGITAIASGSNHSLALKSDGTVVAWGSNSAGQATVPTGLTNVIALAGGGAHTLALKADGTVVAWGSNSAGQITVPTGLSGVIAIAAGDNHSLALKNNGTVVVWGDNSAGQRSVPTGLGGVTAIAAGWNNSAAVKGDGTVVVWGNSLYGQTAPPVGLSGVTALAVGGGFVSALKSDGTVVAWGANGFGESTVPTGLSGVVAVDGGYRHSVALKNDGTVTSWGINDYGQSAIPAGLTGITAVAAGLQHTLALKSDGTVVAWGDNSYGQTSVPAGLTGVIAIAAGDNHSVALKSNGTVVAWGRNDDGQATVSPYLSPVKAIAAGANHTLALTTYGTVSAWGNRSDGQCTVPSDLYGVTAIAAGGYHSVALKSDGTVAAWGWNYFGQSSIPAGLSGVVAVAGGGTHTLALKKDGTVVAWGRNWSGEVSVPAGLSGVSSIAAGSAHSLAIKNDGTVVAWGDSSYGQTMVPPTLGVAEGAVSGSLSYDPATLTVTFTPSAPLVGGAVYHAAISGVRSQGGLPLAAPVRWSFTTMESSLQVAPLAHDFGSQGLTGGPALQSFTLSNNGVTDLVVNAISLVNNGSGFFSVTPGTCQSLTPTIPAGGSCTVTVAYGPTATGAQSATLRIVANVVVNIPLTGAVPIHPLSLTLAGEGAGVVISSAAPDILCNASTCSQTYVHGSLVTLNPAPAIGFTFVGWSGACSGSGPCQLTMESAQAVTADFRPTMDTVAPSITSFSLPASATSLTVPVNAFAASDNVAVTGFQITDTPLPPLANGAGWSGSAPTSFTFASPGNCYAYAWVKDGAGHVSGGVTAHVTIVIDGTGDSAAPRIISFSLQSAASLVASITSLAATDSVGVTGYLVSEDATAPLPADPRWVGSPPASYTFGSYGGKTLFAWAKDGAGNISARATAFGLLLDPAQQLDTVLTAWPDNPPYTGPATFAFVANRPGASFECRVDSQGYAPCTSPVSFGSLANGSHTFSVRARDTGGNYDQSPATYSWLTGAPVIRLMLNAYPTIASALSAIADGDSLEIKGVEITESLVFDRPVSFALKGGFDQVYMNNSGSTTIRGSVVIRSGTVTLDNITIM